MQDTKPPKGTRRGRRSSSPVPSRAERGAPPRSAPEIDLGQTPLGRATLVEMQNDLRATPWPRAPLLTVSYGDVPLDPVEDKRSSLSKTKKSSSPSASSQRPMKAAGSQRQQQSPQVLPKVMIRERERVSEAQHHRVASAPMIEIGQEEVSYDLLSLLQGSVSEAGHARTEEGQPDAVNPAPTRCEALELCTFVVPEEALSPQSNDMERRAFLKQRLAHRLPCSVTEVRRVDVRTLEPGAMLLRVWCPVQ